MSNLIFCFSFARDCSIRLFSQSKTRLVQSQKLINTLSNVSVAAQRPFSQIHSETNHRKKITAGHESWGAPETGIKSKTKQSEAEFLVRIKNDPDQFGDEDIPEEHEKVQDEGDILEEKHLTERPLPQQKLRIKQYADIIKDLIRKRKIKEAIDVLEIRMLKEDRVKPVAYIYNLLLGACGRVGYTKKAFMLYNDMKKRGLNVMGGTYTALFNACANSPWPTTDGLTRARHLYDIMIEKQYQPNDTNYNAMIKAFGRCGDLLKAFELVDEMCTKRFRLKDDTMNFLLQACISDKEAGFRHSLLVWRKLIERNIAPSIYTFNLLLKCVKECGLGDVEVARDVVHGLIGEQQKQNDDEMKLIGENDDNRVDMSLTNNKCTPLRPDLLAVKPHLGNILSLADVTKAEDRLLLLGGSRGFLDTMTQYKCTPDIKTFTLILDAIPSTAIAERELEKRIEIAGVKPDIDFFNMLIKKKSMRHDYQSAKQVLEQMKTYDYRPDLITYGVLAIGCTAKEDALELIEEMKMRGYTLNSIILGAMLRQACHYKNFTYIFEIMEICLRENIAVNQMFLKHLDEFKKSCQEKLAEKQFTKKEEKLFGIFRVRHKNWLTEVQLDDSDSIHPWQQFRQEYPEGIDTNYTVKDSARFKPRHTSLFRVKTSKKWRNKSHQ